MRLIDPFSSQPRKCPLLDDGKTCGGSSDLELRHLDVTRRADDRGARSTGRLVLRGAMRDPAEEVALVAIAKRNVLLRAHRFRLRWEDLEDCYAQAILELVAHVRSGGEFSCALHISNALEQRFLSRIFDRRRALAGRSPAQAMLESARPLGGGGEDGVEIADARLELERIVLLREELRALHRHARGLTADQRLVLACQVGLQMGCADFCRRLTGRPRSTARSHSELARDCDNSWQTRPVMSRPARTCRRQITEPSV